MKILVLCGGGSAERIVSLASGDAVATWLGEAGHDVWKYDPERPGAVHPANQTMAPAEIGIAAPTVMLKNGYNPTVVNGLLSVLEKTSPDFVFPILHGGYGENGTLQALLDWVGVPYAGSGAVASGVAMDKHLTRQLFRVAEVPIADGFVVSVDRMDDADYVRKEIDESFGYPVVVKPRNGGSTVGLTKVYLAGDVSGALRAVSALGDQALVEEHFTGRELTVAVVGNDAYPLIEIRPKEGFYDYANKYTVGRTEYLCPAPVAERDTKVMQEMALKAFEVLGCQGFGRVDFVYADDGRFICLEVNTLPGMTKNSLVPKAAKARGEQPPQLMQKIVEHSLRKSAVAP